MPRKCKNSSDIFCYICGQFTTADQRREINTFIKRCYLKYFGCKLGDQDKPWAPHIACKTCVETLRHWINGKRNSMPFGVPMIWREPTNHTDDCYFCMTKVLGFSKKNKHKIVYPSPPSAIRPVPHSEDLPVPVPPTTQSESESSSESVECQDDVDYTDEHDKSPNLMSQADLDNLVRDLNLSKESAELLGSRLNDRNFLAPGTTFAWYRHREQQFVDFFAAENKLVYCCDVGGLMSMMGTSYDASDWRLFIDSSKRSLKAVLLHNGNDLASIPIAHSVEMTETYDNMKQLLKTIKYDQEKWLICGDLKVISLLLGQQGGYMKYPCFLCLWDSRADDLHYVKKDWPERTEFVPGSHSIKQLPLVDPKNILLPPLHIKLGLMKNFVKALDKDGEAFKYLAKEFPHISDAKLKAGIFIGPQIRQLLNDNQFVSQMVTAERRAWEEFRNVVNNFLGKHKSSDYAEHVQGMISNFRELGRRKNVNMHFLDSHLDYFPANLGSYSEEQGERFHQDISEMECRYQGRWNINMMADYCWSIYRHNPEAEHSRKSQRRQFQRVN